MRAPAGTTVSSTASPGPACATTCPSDSTASSPLDGSTESVSFSPLDSTSARLNGDCGATGVTTRPSAGGETIGPPAEKLYAVEPVGVATITASAAYRTNG